MRLCGLSCAVLAVVACSSCADSEQRTLTIFAASSLTDVYAELAVAFEDAHPDVQVLVSTAGSQTLRLQLERGAPADIFASANGAHVEALRNDSRIAQVAMFASNELVIVVPDDNPAGIEALEQLPHARRIVLGASDVPIGTYTNRLLDSLGSRFRGRVEARVVSRERNVRLVLAKIELGEADAAVVYRTDVRNSVRAIAIPDEHTVRAEYYAGILAGADRELAEEWMALLDSDRGLSIVVAHGFAAPR